MERTIKYRCWDKEHKVMCDVWAIGWKTWHFPDNIINYIEVYPHKNPNGTYRISEDQGILIQYTGLHDSEGVEIYEGDIVKVKTNWKGVELTQEVKWDKNVCGFNLTGGSKHSLFKPPEYKIIGNKWEGLKGERDE